MAYYKVLAIVKLRPVPFRIHTNTINKNTTIEKKMQYPVDVVITIANGVTVTVSGDWTVV